MKRSTALLGLALVCAPLAACADDTYYDHPGSWSSYPYSGWYDGYYGDFYDGYWGLNGSFYFRFRDSDRYYRRDDRHHFRQGDRPPDSHYRRFEGTTRPPPPRTRMPNFPRDDNYPRSDRRDRDRP